MILSPLSAPRQDSLAQEFWDFILPKVNIYEWGEKVRDGYVRANTTNVLNAMLSRSCKVEGRYPQRLTRKIIARHVNHQNKIAVSPNRRSNIVMVMIDVDAHDGQTDARAAAQWIVLRNFPGAYAESSPRGWHVYIMIDSAGTPRAEFNARLRYLQSDLRQGLADNGFEASVEVIGRFTLLTPDRQIQKRGDLATLPLLPAREASLKALKTSPVFKLESPEKTGGFRAKPPTEENRVFKLKNVRATQALRDISFKGGPAAAGVDVENAWDRMRAAGYLLMAICGEVPSIDELLRFYQRYWFAGQDHAERVRRAEDVVKYLEKRKAVPRLAGYFSDSRESLERIVVSRCDLPKGITVEDLSIALYVVTVASFSTAESPARQWTVPNIRISKMFAALRSAGLTSRGGASRRKIILLKKTLIDARLIECVDSRYVPGGRDRGIGKKYMIGPAHPRFPQFCRFAEGVKVKYVGEAMT